MKRIVYFVIAASVFGLSACTNPYDPVQRGLGGGVLGAASGAAIGAAAGGGPGAALGAAIGGATGIFGGVATTPPPPPGTYYGYPAYGYGYPGYGYPAYRYPAYGYPGYPAYPQPGYGYPGYSGAPGNAGPPASGYQGGFGESGHPGPPDYGYPGHAEHPTDPVRRATNTTAMPDTLLNPVPRAMDIKAARHTLPILVPVTDILCMTIPATALRGIGLLGPNTPSNLLAEDLQLILRCETG